jgi:cytochrome P450
MTVLARSCQNLFWLPTPTNRKIKEALDFIHQTILDIINKRRLSGEDRGDLLSMLLLATDEAGTGQMSAEQARDEAVTLFLAGHETTSTLLSWLWVLLAQHPEVTSKLYQELDSVLGDRLPTVADLSQLPYTEMIVKEALRLYPPSWTIGRQAAETVIIEGYTIPRGSLIFASPYVVHRNPQYFDEPEQFIPERFAGNLEKRLPRYAYFPFGGGPRICIGQAFAMMEARLILATIAQRWQWSLAETVTMDPVITMRPQHGVPMRFTARQHSHIPVLV